MGKCREFAESRMVAIYNELLDEDTCIHATDNYRRWLRLKAKLWKIIWGLI